MLIGVYEGYSKPKSADEFLSEFITEMIKLIQDGICFENKIYTVKIRCFIIDAPARSFVLGIKSHAGYYSCTRRTQKGERYQN